MSSHPSICVDPNRFVNDSKRLVRKVKSGEAIITLS